MGAFGPRRVAIPSNGTDDGAPPYPDRRQSRYRCSTSPTSSSSIRSAPASATRSARPIPQDYWGVTEDAQSIAQFIRLWLNENGRWNSPKYLGGESYGTTRTAAVLNQLEGAFNDVSLNGIILISTVLDFGAGADTPGNEMTYILNLPSMAATALYHGKAQARFGRGVRRGGAALRDRALCPRFAPGQRAAAARSARRSGASSRASPAFPSTISTRPTCASRRRASTRNCCATAASRSAGSTPATPAATMTMPARSPTTIPASTASTPATPPRSTSMCARRSASAPTAPTSRSARSGRGTGGWAAAATTTSMSTSRPISAGRCARIAGCGSSSARAITISPRPSSPPNIRCRGPASRATASTIDITARAT